MMERASTLRLAAAQWRALDGFGLADELVDAEQAATMFRVSEAHFYRIQNDADRARGPAGLGGLLAPLVSRPLASGRATSRYWLRHRVALAAWLYTVRAYRGGGPLGITIGEMDVANALAYTDEAVAGALRIIRAAASGWAGEVDRTNGEGMGLDSGEPLP